MGAVFRARDTALGRVVALKILPARFSTDPEGVTRFEREARALATLNHPNIAQVFGLEVVPRADGSGADRRAIAMEFVDGQDLTTKLLGLSDQVPLRARPTAAASSATKRCSVGGNWSGWP